MGLVSVLHDHAPAGSIVVALVQAQVLRSVQLRSFGHDNLQRRCKQPSIRNVGACHDYSERTAVGFDQQAALYAGLGVVGWIRPD
jgi:hypothetical protein